MSKRNRRYPIWIVDEQSLHPAFGPIARTGLMNPEGPCVRWLLSDGRGTTSGSADDAGNIQIQHFDAFGVALETAVISTCPMPNCQTCERGRRATGELGYHGQEGYRTRHYDAYRAEDLPNKSPDHPDYDENYQEGYETPSTGFIQVGARDYDPTIGRWLEPDPVRTGPELQYGQLNRWAYCANDPVNMSDPTGEFPLFLIGLALATVGILFLAYDMYAHGGCRDIGFDFGDPSTWSWQFKLGMTLIAGGLAIALGAAFPSLGTAVLRSAVAFLRSHFRKIVFGAIASFFYWMWFTDARPHEGGRRRFHELLPFEPSTDETSYARCDSCAVGVLLS